MSDYLQTVQDQTIKKLREMLRKFADGDSKTRVVPLAVPTGWGKTRIALQSVFRANYKHKHHTYNPTIFLWPQKTDHLREVWGIRKEDGKVCVEWDGLVDDELELKKKYKKYDFYYVTNDFKNYWAAKKGTTYYKDRNAVKKIIKNCAPGPIVFIVDEWHMDGILEAFGDFLEDKTEKIKECKPQNISRLYQSLATEFIRKFFLCYSKREKVPLKRKLFVLLLSATPISLTKAMDKDDDTDFEKDVQSYVKRFRALASVGNREMVYQLYKNYPQAVATQVKKLKNEKKRNINPNLKKWVKAYCETKVEEGSGLIYMREQYAFAKKNSLKLQALKSLLEEYGGLDKNPEHKFVIFCHYEEVANGVCDYLNKNKARACFLQKKNRELIIDTFNGDVSEEAYNPDYDYPILILMDHDSQGLSLHKNNPWLIHYELAWNPIRIIQRFGRVWRFKKENGQLHLTPPRVFHIPFTYSSEEEQIKRLERRWEFLDSLKPKEAEDKKQKKKKPKKKLKKGKKEKVAKNDIMMDLSPIPMKYALGLRWTPDPEDVG